jgi:hypothetical protein
MPEQQPLPDTLSPCRPADSNWIYKAREEKTDFEKDED